MKTVSLGCLAGLLLLAAGPGPAAEPAAPAASPAVNLPGTAGPVHESLAREARAALDRGVSWLLKQQSPAGHWSRKEFPALTALPLWALVQSGRAPTQAVDKAVAYLLACVHEDGSIWAEPAAKEKGGGLANYNTAVCMVALHAVGRPDLVPVVQKARRYLAGTQHLGSDDYRGGMGYDPDTGRPYADLSNSYMAYEAMRLTQSVEDLRRAGDPKADLDWKAAAEFLARVQNRSDKDNPDDRGGFAYHPGESKAGTYTNEAGAVRFCSYGSMTYAGLLSLIYAEIDRKDPRVQSAFNWSVNHWTVEENPGMGQQGVYYFYNVLAKALAVYGQDQLGLKGGRTLNWRSELINKLVRLQKIDEKTGDGYWVNPENRWWEADKVLTTAYSLLALEIALQGAPAAK